MVVKEAVVKDKSNLNNPSPKHVFIILILAVFVILIILSFAAVKLAKNHLVKEVPTCGDGSFYDTCSLNKPFYCNSDGILIENSDLCGCPSGFSSKNGECSTIYNTGEKIINLTYYLGGNEGNIEFKVYTGVANYFAGVPRSISYSAGQAFSRADFKLKSINNPIQIEYLMPLVKDIQNLAPNSKEDQFRIAVSLVQHIPFGGSNETTTFGGSNIDYARYPYEVLYDGEGVCGEKTEFLAFLLKEIGYGVASFYYPDENHEALGVKCPADESLGDTGYCFIETSGPSVITEKELSYVGIGKLISTPEISLLATGNSLGKNLYEYKDARKLNRIRKSIEKNGKLNPLQHRTYEKLKNKYGLGEEYYSG